jgi:hypothetical protein
MRPCDRFDGKSTHHPHYDAFWFCFALSNQLCHQRCNYFLLTRLGRFGFGQAKCDTVLPK